ncbi:MAG: ABC transporter permease [Candidatus Dojkabacteria bacterium]
MSQSIVASTKRIVWIARMNSYNILRNFKSAGILFVLPAIFMGIFALAFGTDFSEQEYEIGLVRGEAVSEQQFQAFQEILGSEDSPFNYEIFENEQDALNAIEEDELAAYALLEPGSLTLRGDQFEAEFEQVSTILETFAGRFFGIDNSFFMSEPIGTQEDTIKSPFDIVAPGLMIYGILILIPAMAQQFTQLEEKNLTFRLFTSRANAFEVIAGTAIYYLFLSMLQSVLLYYTAIIFGYNGFQNIVLTMVVAIPIGLFTTGLALIIGSLVSKVDSASNAGTILSVVLGFLSGAFIGGVSDVFAINIAGNTYAVTDLLPSKQATDALIAVLSQGKGIDAIYSELIISTLGALITLVLGTILYWQLKFRRLQG